MPEPFENTDSVNRRAFVKKAAIAAGTVGLAGSAASVLAASVNAQASTRASAAGGSPLPEITFPPISAPTERQEGPPPNPEPPDQRVGYCVVGLGRIALNQVIPGISQSKHAKLVAVVSGDAGKANIVARQYGVDPKNVYSYQSFDQIKSNPAIDVVYVALPNSMHAEYTIRAARAGKHVLCEKPMATSVADAEKMVDACKAAGKKLMIAYRIQYEPYNRAAKNIVRNKELGAVKVIEMANAQSEGTPDQWRLKQAMSGGGSLPDVGIYCLNTARYLTGEEPAWVSATMYKTPNDPRFADVPEESIIFQLRFPSGILVNAFSGYSAHRTQRYRVSAADGWVDLDPAFPYRGLRMRVARADGKAEKIEERVMEEKHQFALEIDHFSECVRANRQPFTPGEEGVQDMKLIAAIYESARTGKPVSLAAVTTADAFRGTPPAEG
jgi:predicted dehydrogenase